MGEAKNGADGHEGTQPVPSNALPQHHNLSVGPRCRGPDGIVQGGAAEAAAAAGGTRAGSTARGEAPLWNARPPDGGGGVRSNHRHWQRRGVEARIVDAGHPRRDAAPRRSYP